MSDPFDPDQVLTTGEHGPGARAAYGELHATMRRHIDAGRARIAELGG